MLHNVRYGISALRDGSNNAALWQADATNAFGQITSSTLGNGLTRNTAYNPGNLTLQGITLINGAAPIDDIAYDFTPASGNLQQRNDVTNARNEVFGYDALNRLGSINLNNTGAKSITYEPGGNIKTKFDVGTYQYANSNHAVSGISPLAAGYTPPSFSLTHTSFDRPATITQGAQKLTIAYGPDRQRNVSSYHVNNVLQTTRYYNGDYEKEVSGSTTKEYDYVYSPEGLTAIAVKTGSARTLYYAHTDHLGSLRVLTDANKSTISRYRYDAWGQRTLISGTDITNRGFTMHEHVDAFGLINMNARLYDPMMGRFLSPDPFVQMPDFTQSYNRYSYALNNPLIYTDPSGEFLLGFIAGFWKGVFTWKNPFKTAWQGGVNETKIWAGLFVSDKNKDLGGQIWEVVSRFTWQLPQTILGIGFSHLSNYAGQIDNVDYEGGATVSSGNYWGQGDGAAITLGSYITGGRSLDDDPNNSLFQHEYGHYIQSQRTGWGYLVSHGIPSLISAAKDEPGYDHDDFWTEQDANKKAYEYFYSKMGSKLIWYFGDNPINDANWVNAVQSKYSKNAMQSNYWRSHQTVYTPMPSYPFNYFNWNHTRQGIDDYRRNTHRSDGSSVRSLKELLLLYKR